MTRKALEPGRVYFRAGYFKESHKGVSVASEIQIDPGFLEQEQRPIGALHDWALVTLRDEIALRPIGVRVLAPDEARELAIKKSFVQVGYGWDRPYSPSRLDDCKIEFGGTLDPPVYHCLTAKGYSGAPILAFIGGEPFITAIGSRGPTQTPVDRDGFACPASEFASAIEEKLRSQP